MKKKIDIDKTAIRKNLMKEVIKYAIIKPFAPKHNTEIFEYIRRRKSGKTMKVGVITGINDNGIVRIGWSKCNIKLKDKFDSLLGLQLATIRAMKPDGIPTPNCIKGQVRNFCSRCVRYFKDAKKIEMPV